MADAAAHPRRAPCQLRLRARNDTAHPHHAARQARLAATPVALKADVTWLVCEKECIPGEARLSLTLPVAAPGVATALDAAHVGVLSMPRARSLPQPSPWPARMEVAPDRLTLQVDAQGLNAGRHPLRLLLPHAETLVQHAAPQQLRGDPRRPRPAPPAQRALDRPANRCRRRAGDGGGPRAPRRRSRHSRSPTSASSGHGAAPHASRLRSPPSCRPLCSPSSAASSST